jgi:FdhD protein
MARPVTQVRRRVFTETGESSSERAIPEETAIALSYNGGTAAVMMATPDDLEDFAVGFSMTEGIVTSPTAIRSLEVVPEADGIELRMWLDEADAARLNERRRMMAGPTGCGLCGVDSLAQAVRPAARVVQTLHVTPEQIMQAVASITPAQALNRETRAVHAAAFWHPANGLVALREDVGRHNALDKLIGRLVLDRVDTKEGFVFLSSRASYELVRKAARVGIPMLATISAPSSLAIAIAKKAQLRLVSFCRESGYVDYGTR